MLLSIHLSQFSNPSFLFEWIQAHWFSVEGQYDIVLLLAKMKLYLVHRCKYSPVTYSSGKKCFVRDFSTFEIFKCLFQH